MKKAEIYKNKIYHCAIREIQKNEIYAKLLLIDNEQFRAFLYYKIMQEYKFNVNIDISISIKNNDFFYYINFTDLIRVIGIFIGNAICIEI